jgi:hypothetical protein
LQVLALINLIPHELFQAFEQPTWVHWGSLFVMSSIVMLKVICFCSNKSFKPQDKNLTTVRISNSSLPNCTCPTSHCPATFQKHNMRIKTSCFPRGKLHTTSLTNTSRHNYEIAEKSPQQQQFGGN